MSSRYCEVCDRWFPHARALSQHTRDSAVYHPTCEACDSYFGSFTALQQHFSECHYYCRDCNRFFQSAANLNAHRGSSLDNPRSFKCPGRSCNRAFVSMSALILHAESGTCPSGVTRKIINDHMARIDTQNAITNPARMITGASEPEYWATERSWNGYGYACCLCNAEFQTLSSLNQHLKSPRHLQPFYHCPKRTCNLQFTVLSALCQHVERGSCGARETRLVQDAVEHLRRGMRTLTS